MLHDLHHLYKGHTLVQELIVITYLVKKFSPGMSDHVSTQEQCIGTGYDTRQKWIHVTDMRLKMHTTRCTVVLLTLWVR